MEKKNFKVGRRRGHLIIVEGSPWIQEEGNQVVVVGKVRQKAEKGLRTGGVGQGGRRSVGEREASRNCCARGVGKSSHELLENRQRSRCGGWESPWLLLLKFFVCLKKPVKPCERLEA